MEFIDLEIERRGVGWFVWFLTQLLCCFVPPRRFEFGCSKLIFSYLLVLWRTHMTPFPRFHPRIIRIDCNWMNRFRFDSVKWSHWVICYGDKPNCNLILELVERAMVNRLSVISIWIIIIILSKNADSESKRIRKTECSKSNTHHCLLWFSVAYDMANTCGAIDWHTRTAHTSYVLKFENRLFCRLFFLKRSRQMDTGDCGKSEWPQHPKRLFCIECPSVQLLLQTFSIFRFVIDWKLSLNAFNNRPID